MAVIFESLIYDLALVSISVVICLYKYLTSTFNYWKDRGVPYIEPVPFFGNTKDQLLGAKSVYEMHQTFYDTKKGERYVGIFEFRSPVLVIRDPELAEKILIKDFSNFHDRAVSADTEHDPLSANLFALHGNKWRNLRYKLTPTFTSGKLKGMFEHIQNCGDRLVAFIRKESKSKKAIEGKSLLSNFTCEVISSVAFGLHLDKDNEASKRLRTITERMTQPSAIQMLRVAFIMTFRKFSKQFGIRPMQKEVYDTVMPLIKETLNYRRVNNANRNDFLQLMLNLQKQEKDGVFKIQKGLDYQTEDDVIDQMKHVSKVKEDEFNDTQKQFMTDSVIAAQAFIFFAAGSDTVSNTISLVLFALTQNPEVQKKVHNEIDSILVKNDNKWSYDVVKGLIYLEQVMQESQRMYPAAPFIFRMCTETYKVPDSSLVLEKGVRIVIPMKAIQNDPLYCDSPQVFNPDRFKDNNYKPSSTFFPFGNGPRVCIAMRFAILEVKIALAKILSEYTVKLNSKTKVPFTFSTKSVLITPEDGFWFEFDERVNA